MSYEDDFRSSPKSEYQRSRSSVSTNLWATHGIEEDTKKLWCDVCKVRLIPKENGRMLFCKVCGKYTNIADYSKEKKLTPRYPSPTAGGGGSTVISKDIRKKKQQPIESANADLSEEDKRELQSYGLNI